MAQPLTLNELSHLRETRFGQPSPRHGLSLLCWFAQKCIQIDDDGNMIALHDPEEGMFGFHPFHNSEGILPDTGLQYYEVGNLSHSGMPPYVTRNHNIDVHESNADRIVVSVDSDEDDNKWFDRIYVTHHLAEGRFDDDSTFRISQGLIRIIQNKNWSDFIREVKIRKRRKRRGHRCVHMQSGV